MRSIHFTRCFHLECKLTSLIIFLKISKTSSPTFSGAVNKDFKMNLLYNSMHDNTSLEESLFTRIKRLHNFFSSKMAKSQCKTLKTGLWFSISKLSLVIIYFSLIWSQISSLEPWTTQNTNLKFSVEFQSIYRHLLCAARLHFSQNYVNCIQKHIKDSENWPCTRETFICTLWRRQKR